MPVGEGVVGGDKHDVIVGRPSTMDAVYLWKPKLYINLLPKIFRTNFWTSIIIIIFNYPHT